MSSFAKDDDHLTTVTYFSKANNSDQRRNYEKQVLELALEKTKVVYGSYRTVPARLGLSYSRELEEMRLDRYTNHIRSFPISLELANDEALIFIEFPIYLGGLGYRVCFTSDSIKDKIKQIRTFGDLSQFSFVQGTGWRDASILREAGLKVYEISNYESLFKMTAMNRVDFFCRGINEYMNELKRYKDLPGLTLDKTFAIYYPFPRYFYTNKNNHSILKRIEEGLKLAYSDGSFQALWAKYHLQGFRRANLGQRRVFYLENQSLYGLASVYKKYFYQPDKVKESIYVGVDNNKKNQEVQ